MENERIPSGRYLLICNVCRNVSLQVAIAEDSYSAAFHKGNHVSDTCRLNHMDLPLFQVRRKGKRW